MRKHILCTIKEQQGYNQPAFSQIMYFATMHQLTYLLARLIGIENVFLSIPAPLFPV